MTTKTKQEEILEGLLEFFRDESLGRHPYIGMTREEQDTWKANQILSYLLSKGVDLGGE